MNKKELIDKIKTDTQLSEQDAINVVNEILENITNLVSQNQRIDLRGFGVFSLRSYKARKGRNPRTGQEITIPARKVINFRLSRVLRQEIKNKIKNNL
jgi:DNA-binding protein HU-beta